MLSNLLADLNGGIRGAEGGVEAAGDDPTRVAPLRPHIAVGKATEIFIRLRRFRISKINLCEKKEKVDRCS